MRNNFLKSFSVHDEQLLTVMYNMVKDNPNTNVTEASHNVLNIEGNVKEFLESLVQVVPVLNMKMYKIKTPKTEKLDCDVHCIYFTFHNLDVERRRMKKSNN